MTYHAIYDTDPDEPYCGWCDCGRYVWTTTGGRILDRSGNEQCEE